VIFSEDGKDDMQQIVNDLPDNSEVKQLVIEQQVIEEQIDTSSWFNLPLGFNFAFYLAVYWYHN
jgi:hypothetical protein